jgi:hypothetical protein
VGQQIVHGNHIVYDDAAISGQNLHT